MTCQSFLWSRMQPKFSKDWKDMLPMAPLFLVATWVAIQ